MKIVPCITFASVARQVAERGWRPFPGLQTSKVPAMQEWSALNRLEWDNDDLAAAAEEYQPVYDYCCCLAVQREIVALDADILNPEHAAYAAELADSVLGVTPLIRIGLAPKCIRVSAPAISFDQKSSILSKFSAAPVNSSASAGMGRQAVRTSGHTNLRSPSTPIAALSQQ